MVAAANHRDFYLSSVIEIKHLFFGVRKPCLRLHGYKAEAWLQHSIFKFFKSTSRAHEMKAVSIEMHAFCHAYDVCQAHVI
jgi:hypothetical protein